MSVPTAGPRTADPDSFAWQVLSTLTSSAGAAERRAHFEVTFTTESSVPVAGGQPGPAAEMTDDTSGDSGTRGSEERAERVRLRHQELFGVYRDAGASESARLDARDGLVTLHLPLVEHCARRFRNRGEPLEDLVQVGTIGLIKSIDRFDLDRGVEFSTYATPTIIGEIKRYFRDKGWAIRVPRRLQELRMQIGSTTAELTQEPGPLPHAARAGARRSAARSRRSSRGSSPATPTPRSASTPRTTPATRAASRCSR